MTQTLRLIDSRPRDVRPRQWGRKVVLAGVGLMGSYWLLVGTMALLNATTIMLCELGRCV